jgi:hypothetical protein
MNDKQGYDSLVCNLTRELELAMQTEFSAEPKAQTEVSLRANAGVWRTITEAIRGTHQDFTQISIRCATVRSVRCHNHLLNNLPPSLLPEKADLLTTIVKFVKMSAFINT